MRIVNLAYQMAAGGTQTVAMRMAAELRKRRLVAETSLPFRVQFLGELAPTAIPDFLSAGNPFAFRSRWEGFGLAFLRGAVRRASNDCERYSRF